MLCAFCRGLSGDAAGTGLTPLDCGFDACNAARFGRECSGIGGGALPSNEVSLGFSVGKFGAISVDLFIPQESAERRGAGDSWDVTRTAGICRGFSSR